MSGSSNASHTFSRCVVTLDAGISISWAPDPDGSYEHGQRHHQREEASFRARLEHATPAIEVLFDELEEAGHVFTAPGEPRFRDSAQRGANGAVEMCEVQLCCKPTLSEPELASLAERINKLLVHVPRPSPPPPEPEAQPVIVAKKPWWKLW
jgi:hypothetical protein